ncbi:acyl-CoA carboxylase subunit epsilon [Arthrobacter sp. H14]|uniref:acyl-CoA carboxylase subunit epsilon n=1 Tax=Arthrobacter sp. H14 TaxID=1312959 RepID=UPI000478A333|nr:acyl-CoA carboxylase subunit epsilon [Arthrobacter sp. H14]
MTSNSQEKADAPLFSVVHGNPNDEEIAALAAVVMSLGSPDTAPEPKRRTRAWIRRHQLRLRPAPGPGSWRRSRG